MQTLDGKTITTIEQDGDYAGQDIGRIWIQNRQTWAWYGGFANEARRKEILTEAQRRTFVDFDAWFDTAP